MGLKTEAGLVSLSMKLLGIINVVLSTAQSDGASLRPASLKLLLCLTLSLSLSLCAVAEKQNMSISLCKF